MGFQLRLISCRHICSLSNMGNRHWRRTSNSDSVHDLPHNAGDVALLQSIVLRLLSRSSHDLRWEVKRLFPIIHHLSLRCSDVGYSFWFMQMRDRLEGPQGPPVIGQVAAWGKVLSLDFDRARRKEAWLIWWVRGERRTAFFPPWLATSLGHRHRPSPAMLTRVRTHQVVAMGGRRKGLDRGARVISPGSRCSHVAVGVAESPRRTSSLSRARGGETRGDGLSGPTAPTPPHDFESFLFDSDDDFDIY